jgi:hypothetical protein
MNKPPARAVSTKVAAFLAKAKSLPAVRAGAGPGRLIFALDATASREPMWERARALQADMFRAANEVGELEIQLAWYAGAGFFEATPFAARAEPLLAAMRNVACAPGETQIERVLDHAAAETRRRKVAALVFVGDAMEESLDLLSRHAGALGLLGLPCFMFLEGRDEVARTGFERIARLSGGAFAPFDASSPQTLRDLLSAVATFAAGGRPALEDFSRRRGGPVALLTSQLGRPRGA